MRARSIYALVVASVILTALPAFAAFTPYNPPPPWDATLQQVLNSTYGGFFNPTGTGNRDWTNGAISLVRVEDTYDPLTLPAAPLSLTENVGNDDRFWTADFLDAKAEAVWGVYQQKFGYFEGTSGGTYVNLFDVNGYAYDVTGQADLTSLKGKTIRFARAGENRTFSSDPANNTLDNLDHLITFRVEGLNNNKLTWLLFWEDKLPWEQNADFDYEDLVIQITATPSQTSPTEPNVPEPGTLTLLLPAALLALRRRV